jgi:PLP dependent protein
VNSGRGIAENLRDIETRIARAAAGCGRDPREIRLVAVTKGQPPEAVAEALAAGAREFGENYVQEAQEKFAGIEASGCTRHFIGRLQKNKAGKAAALFEMVQSVDSLGLAQALGRRAEALGRRLDVLIEVNVSGDAARPGVAPAEAVMLAVAAAAVPGLEVCGLMTIAPLGADERETASSFRTVARVYEQLPREQRRVLSMGMTGDFESAIAEGSTMVRIGTGIFGPRRSNG